MEKRVPIYTLVPIDEASLDKETMIGITGKIWKEKYPSGTNRVKLQEVIVNGITFYMIKEFL